MNKCLSRLPRAVLAILFLFIASGTWAESDEALRTRLIGQWQEFRLLECEGHQHFIKLEPDGSFEVNGVIHACDKKTPFVWRGNWYVKDGKFGYATTYSNPPDEYPVGETFEDEIVSVTDSEWTMVEQSTGNKSIAFRIK